MKKYLLYLCLLCITGCSCSSNNNKTNKSTNAVVSSVPVSVSSSSVSNVESTEETVSSSTSSENEVIDTKTKKDIINKLNTAVENSNPTKIVNATQYYYQDIDVVLNFNSILLINYDGLVTSMYDYSYQKLNPIGSGASEMVSTFSGVYYGKGNSVGEAVNDKIVWNNAIDGVITLLNFNLDVQLVDISNYTDKEVTMPVKDEHISDFMRKDYGIKDLTFKMVLNDDATKVVSIRMDYSTGANAKVVASLSFSYEKQYFEVQ